MTRRLASILMSSQLVAGALSPRAGLFKHAGHEIPIPPFDAVRLDGGIPAGARLVAAGMNTDADLVLTFEHESFAPVEEGARPPVLSPPQISTQAAGYCLWGHACRVCRES